MIKFRLFHSYTVIDKWHIDVSESFVAYRFYNIYIIVFIQLSDCFPLVIRLLIMNNGWRSLHNQNCSLLMCTHASHMRPKMLTMF